jgi:KDO2-lipid IV(A) lauroyltransferase
MILYVLYRLGLWLTALLPWALGRRVAEWGADRYRRWCPADRAIVRSNLSLLLSEEVGEEDARVREVFRHFGWYLLEFFRGHRDDLHVTTNGYQHLLSAARRHPGCIVLTGHVGNWEMGAVLLARAGWPISVVALSHTNPRVNRVFDDQRRRCGVGVIPFGPHAAAQCLRTLQQGGVLGLAADRDYGTEGLSVAFAGHRWVVPRGPAVLSLRTGAPVLPTFCTRQSSGAFQLCIEPPIWPPEGPWAEGEVRTLTQRYAQAIEGAVRRFPTQWLMFTLLGSATP